MQITFLLQVVDANNMGNHISSTFPTPNHGYATCKYAHHMQRDSGSQNAKRKGKKIYMGGSMIRTDHQKKRRALRNPE